MKKISGLYIFSIIALVALLLFPNSVQAAVDDGYTVALLHMNGVDNSTTFTDESGKSWTANGDAQISTSQSKFGGASGLFDGTGGLSISDSDDFYLPADFTIDFWLRPHSLPTGGGQQYLFYQATDSNNNFQIFLYGDGNLYLQTYAGGSLIMNLACEHHMSNDGPWYHFAIVRNANTWTIYENGTLTSWGGNPKTSSENPLNYTGNIYINSGSGSSGFYNGWMDEFRISKGIARWTSNFTPPTSEYEPTPTETPTISNTPTNTSIATDTFTPTVTSTPTITTTSTLTPTFTSTSTLTPTVTFTTSPTVTPMDAIIWAPSPFSISIALQNALASTLIAAPPAGSSENVYGVISAQSDGSGGWYISLVNIVGVAPPYTGWSALANGQWSGSMDCSGTEPTWTCDFYNPTSIFGGTGGLVFPWQPGTYAIYGQEGIHHDVNCTGGCALPGDDAVDFVSGDALGASAMPPYAYAAEAGTVTWSCQGVHNGGLIISGASGKFMYFHLAPGQAAFTLGATFQQGQQIGRLAYGTFDETPCGSASQGSTDYHLHFAWYPSGNTFSIGGCILDLITQNWLCGTTTIGILGHLNNAGGSSPAPTPSGPTITPGGPTLTPVPGQIGTVVGGEHIWNGIIQAVIDFIHTNASAILPTHISSATLSDAVNNAWSTVMDFGWMIQSLQMIWILPGLIVWGIMLSVEIVRWIFVGYRMVVRLFPMP